MQWYIQVCEIKTDTEKQRVPFDTITEAETQLIAMPETCEESEANFVYNLLQIDEKGKEVIIDCRFTKTFFAKQKF